MPCPDTLYCRYFKVLVVFRSNQFTHGQFRLKHNTCDGVWRRCAVMERDRSVLSTTATCVDMSFVCCKKEVAVFAGCTTI